jgi:hypoxanthine phosphoribosyltransferase
MVHSQSLLLFSFLFANLQRICFDRPGFCSDSDGGKEMKHYELVPCVSAEELEKRVAELASRINTDYEGKSLILVGILKGAFIFLADLARRISVPVEIDFVRLASYGQDSETSGEVRITHDLELSVQGKHVLVVEDIVDTGITLAWFIDHLNGHQPESVKICALIDKSERRKVEVRLDYVGIRMEEGFLVGYGLDFAERHRNLPSICEVRFSS